MLSTNVHAASVVSRAAIGGNVAVGGRYALGSGTSVSAIAFPSHVSLFRCDRTRPDHRALLKPRQCPDLFNPPKPHIGMCVKQNPRPASVPHAEHREGVEPKVIHRCRFVRGGDGDGCRLW